MQSNHSAKAAFIVVVLIGSAGCEDAGTGPSGTGGEGGDASATIGGNTDGGSTGSMTSSGGGGSASAGQGGAPPPAESWFSTDFNDLDANGSNLYDFDNRFPQPAGTWTHTHTTDQGWLGSAAPHVTIHGCASGAPGCNTSEHQFNAGWSTPPVGATPASGDSVFIRYRIKFDPGTEFPMEKFGAKFILFGSTGVEPNSRWIIHLMPPKENQGCTLDFESYPSMGWEPPPGTWSEAEDWGFSDFGEPPIAGLYGSFQSNINIGWSCNPGVLVTRSDHAMPVPKPQNVGAAPVEGWYHLQFEAVSGDADQTTFRTWANNNNQALPSSERTNMPEALGVTGWNGSVDVVGYWGTADIPDMGFIIDDFEIGPVFDPNWAQ